MSEMVFYFEYAHCILPGLNLYRAFQMYSGITKMYYRKTVYLYMLQLWYQPQLQNIPTFIYQQDGSPAHFHYEVREHSVTRTLDRASVWK